MKGGPQLRRGRDAGGEGAAFGVLSAALLATLHAVLLAGAGGALLARSAAAELKARSTIQGGDLVVHESAEWRITLEGSGTTVPEPEFRDPGWAEVTPTGTEQSVHFGPGGMSSAVIYRFLVVPQKAGRFELPAVTLRVGQNRVTTAPVPVVVLREALPRSGASAAGGDLRLVVALDRERAVLGQAVRMTARFSQARRLSERQYWGPATPGFWTEPGSVPRSYYTYEAGRRWLVTEWHTFLYPAVTGKLTVGAARMLCLVERDPGSLLPPSRIGTPGEEVVSVESQPVELAVSELPGGRPAEFEGGVGDFSLVLSAERDTIRADETWNLSIRLSGEGNLRIAGLPEWGELADFEVYGRATEDSIDLSGSIPRGARRVDLSLLPRRQGVLGLPPLAYAAYTPGQGYRRLVLPGRQLAVGPPLGRLGGAGSVAPLESPEGVVRPPRPTAGWLMLAVGVAGFAWAAAWLARQRLRRLETAALPAQARRRLRELARGGRQEEFLRQAELLLSAAGGAALGEGGAHQVVLSRVRALRYGGGGRAAGLAELAAAVDRLLRASEPRGLRPGTVAAWAVLALALAASVGGAHYGLARSREGAAGGSVREAWSAAVKRLARGEDLAAESGLDSLWRAGWRGGPLAAQASLAALRGRRLGRAALWTERARREDAGHPYVQAVRRALDEEGALPGHPEGLAARVPARRLALAGAGLLALGQILLALAAAGRGGWRWAGGGLTLAALAALAAALAVEGAGFGDRAGVIVRGTPLRPEPEAEAELDLEPGRLVLAHEAREGYRRVGLGGGLTGWVWAGDVVAVRVAGGPPGEVAEDGAGAAR